MRGWNQNGIDVGDLVRLDDGEFDHRIGHCWARGRLRHGDVLVAVQLAGDCFFDWLLVDAQPTCIGGRDERHLHLRPVPALIGAYTLGRPIGHLSSDQLATLVSGQSIDIDVPEAYETPARTEDEYVDFTTYRDLGKLIGRMTPGMLARPVRLADDGGCFGDGGTLTMGPHDQVTMIGNA